MEIEIKTKICILVSKYGIFGIDATKLDISDKEFIRNVEEQYFK